MAKTNLSKNFHGEDRTETKPATEQLPVSFRHTLVARCKAAGDDLTPEQFEQIVRTLFTDGTALKPASHHALAIDIEHAWIHYGYEVKKLDYAAMVPDLTSEA